jgi:hypothetical protein
LFTEYCYAKYCYGEYFYAEYCFAEKCDTEYHYADDFTPNSLILHKLRQNIDMLHNVVLNIIMLSAAMLSVIILIVVAPLFLLLSNLESWQYQVTITLDYVTPKKQYIYNNKENKTDLKGLTLKNMKVTLTKKIFNNFLINLR